MKLNIFTVSPSNSTPIYRPKRNENICTHEPFMQISIAALFTIARKRNQPIGPSTGEWINTT